MGKITYEESISRYQEYGKKQVAVLCVHSNKFMVIERKKLLKGVHNKELCLIMSIFLPFTSLFPLANGEHLPGLPAEKCNFPGGLLDLK